LPPKSFSLPEPYIIFFLAVCRSHISSLSNFPFWWLHVSVGVQDPNDQIFVEAKQTGSIN
jgi:hypothetical protein